MAPTRRFLTELHAKYQDDPASVDPEWRGFFASLGDAADDILAEARGPSWSKQNGTALSTTTPPAFNHETALAASRDTLGARLLIRAYRTRGHLIAKLDPLELGHPPRAS